jgi:hypothetical protein
MVLHVFGSNWWVLEMGRNDHIISSKFPSSFSLHLPTQFPEAIATWLNGPSHLCLSPIRRAVPGKQRTTTRGVWARWSFCGRSWDGFLWPQRWTDKKDMLSTSCWQSSEIQSQYPQNSIFSHHLILRTIYTKQMLRNQ